MDKYYTPRIEEFHIGFEYESFDPIDSFWIPSISNSYTISWLYGHKTISDWVRVKYLDKEDIESLGFKIDEWVNIENFGDVMISYSELLHRIRIKTKDFYRDNSGRYDDLYLIYRLEVKNKSELIKLLKQLGINE